MSDWAPQPIRDLIESEWPGEWGTEPAPPTPGVVVYRSTDIDDAGHLNEMDGGAYRSIPAGKLVAKRLRPGDILLEASGGTPDRPVGRVALFAGMRDEPAMSSNFLRTLRPKKSVDCHFVCWALLNLHEQPAIWRYQQQTTGIINLKTSDYLGHEVLVPSLARQRRIAEILSAVDEAIEETEKLIAKHQQIKAGLMHDLFTRGLTPDGHLRPPHSEAPHLYKDSPLGPIPKEWETLPLRALTAKIADRDHTTPRYVADGVLMVSPTNLVDDEDIDFGACQRIPEPDHRINSKKTDIRAGDLILHRIGAGLGAVRLVTADMPEFSILHSMAQIRPLASRVRSEFLLWAFRCPSAQSQMELGTQSIGVPDLGLDKIAGLQFTVPSLTEQSMIAERLRAQGAITNRERERVRKLVGIKQGLMHDLLTGEVLVPIPEAEDG